jgi:hypothetical protein
MAPEGPTGGAGGFDISSINRNDLGVMIAGAVAFIASFFPFYGVSIDSGVPGFSGSSSVSAWHSYGTLGILLVLIGAIVIAVKTFAGNVVPANLPVGIHIVAGVLAGLGTLLLILRAFTYDSVDAPGISAGVKWGAYVLFVAAIVETVFAFLGMREAEEKFNFSGGAGSPPPPPSA